MSDNAVPRAVPELSQDQSASPVALDRDEGVPARVTQRTLAAWRAELAKIREEERRNFRELPAETGRLLEIVGQALAQGGGALPSADITRIEALTHVDVTYSQST